MFGMRAAFLDYAHYSTPIDGENLLSIDDKWTSYHGKSTVICCNDNLATQRYDSGIFNLIQHAGLSSVTSFSGLIWQHSSSSLFPSLYPSLRPFSLVSSDFDVVLHMKAPLCSPPSPALGFLSFLWRRVLLQRLFTHHDLGRGGAACYLLVIQDDGNVTSSQV